MANSTQSDLPPFLLLPLEIRESIYSWAGLVRGCPINIKDEKNRWSILGKAFSRDTLRSGGREATISRIKTWHRNGGDAFCTYEKKGYKDKFHSPGMGCIHDSLSTHIFRICQQICQEAEFLFYSKNIFLIEPNTIFSLPERSFAWLRFLEVRLTSCSCVSGHKCADLQDYEDFDPCDFCHFYCRRGTGDPLALENGQDKRILAQWTGLCSKLGENCSEDLNLTLICDCAELQTAVKVVDPLSTFPKLKYASVRLGQRSGSDLGALAESTVRHLTGVKPLMFPFQKLPNELQELVLTYTDLQAPDYLSWNEAFDDRRYWTDAQDHGNSARGFRISFDSLLRCCVSCTRSREVCACPARHAASFSGICTCWSFPASLFLVSKTINRMAKKVFFSRNRFTLWDTNRYQHGRILPKNACLAEPVQILRQMPHDWSSNIRWLRFLWKHGIDLRVLDGDHQIWKTLATLIKTWPTVEQLTVEFDFVWRDHGHNMEWHIGPHELEKAIQMFHTVASLFRLDDKRHYKDFFFRFAYLVDTSEEDWARWELEKELERKVMGIDDYDAALRGKYRNQNLRYDESLRPKLFWKEEQGMYWFDERLYRP